MIIVLMHAYDAEKGSLKRKRPVRQCNSQASKLVEEPEKVVEVSSVGEEGPKSGGAKKLVVRKRKPLMWLRAQDNSAIVVAHGRVADDHGPTFHCKPIPSGHAVYHVTHVAKKKALLCFPNLGDDPPQRYVGDAENGVVLWPDALVSPAGAK